MIFQMFYKNDKENIFICGDILKGMKTELLSCAECNKPIYDRFFLNVGGYSWHGKCLKCCRCSLAFDQQQKCYLRDRQVYCKNDYIKEFCMKCSKCDIYIAPSDWVRRARNLVFHLACFSCESCSRQLGTGDQFALLDDRVLCKEHYLDTMDCGTTDSDDNVDGEGYHKSKAKRVRTTFTEDQLQVLQANFQIDSNPDGQDLERIASVTGLTKRVTQVWFQNSRARQKKHIHAVPRENDGNPYSRHINLQLNYTFQSNNSHITNGINNNNNNNHNNNNNNNHINNNNVNNHNHNNGNSKSSMYTHESSLDELSQDSNSMHCMQAEV